MIMVLLAAFTAGCTATSIEEENYDNEIQLIDKEHARRPGKQGDCGQEKQSGDN